MSAVDTVEYGLALIDGGLIEDGFNHI